MNYLFAGLRDRVHSIRIVLSDRALYMLPSGIDDAIEYSAEDSLEEGEWFKVDSFSMQSYCLSWLKETINGIDIAEISPAEYQIMDYLCSYQNENEFFFQRLTKRSLLHVNKIHFGDSVKYIKDSLDIPVREYPDALYVKDRDCLYFRQLQPAAAIFKGMEQLYRIATEAETLSFLALDCLEVDGGFSADKVSKPNLKRIALAFEYLNSYDEQQQESVFDAIRSYVPRLQTKDGKFQIKTDADLQTFLWGIAQRYYTTADGRKKLIASAIRELPTP